MPRASQSKGGLNRAKALTPEQRSEIARQGALARWAVPSLPDGQKPPKAIASGILPLGSIPCAVLDDGDNTRVLTQSGFLRALGRFPYPGGASANHLANLPAFLRAKSLEPFLNNNLVASSAPIIFDTGLGGSLAVGFRAQVLPQVCWVYAKARMAGKLTKGQEHVGDTCLNLLEGLSDTAIDALVDEATGFQDIRAKDALIKLLEKYVSKDALPWVRTFDNDFYKEMFRIHGYKYDPTSVKRPMIFAKRTEDIYNRLAPGVRERLQELVRRNVSGRALEKLFQHLSKEDGYEELTDLIKTAKICMRLSHDYKDYERKLDKLHPRFTDTLPLDLD